MEELCRIRKREEEEAKKQFEEAANELERVSLRLKEYEKQLDTLTEIAKRLPELKQLKGEYTRKEEALKGLFVPLKQVRSCQLELTELNKVKSLVS